MADNTRIIETKSPNHPSSRRSSIDVVKMKYGDNAHTSESHELVQQNVSDSTSSSNLEGSSLNNTTRVINDNTDHTDEIHELVRQNVSDSASSSNPEDINSREEQEHRKKVREGKRTQKDSQDGSFEQWDSHYVTNANDSSFIGSGGDDNDQPEDDRKMDETEGSDFDDEQAKHIYKIIRALNKYVVDLSGEKVPISPHLKEEIHQRLSEQTPENIRYQKKITDLLKTYDNKKDLPKRDKEYFIKEHRFLEERYGRIMNKVESKRTVGRWLYTRLHSSELGQITKTIQFQFMDQKYQRLAGIEAKRVNDLMMQCLRDLQLEGEMNDPGLHSLLLRHAEHARKIVKAASEVLVNADKKYLEEYERNPWRNLWSVRSAKLALSYRDDLLAFASEIESGRTDNFLALLNAHLSKTRQSSDGSGNVPVHNKQDGAHKDQAISPDKDAFNENDAISLEKNASNDQSVSTQSRSLGVSGEGLVKKLAKNEGYHYSEQQEDTRQKTWRVYNKLKASVLAFAGNLDKEAKRKQDSKLKQEIEQHLRTDQKYRGHVEALLASQEVDDEVADYFIGIHKPYIQKRSEESNHQVWSVYNMLTRSVFKLSEKPEVHAALQREIEQHLRTDQKYREHVDALLASQEVDDKVANYFVQAHKKESERQEYQKDKQEKQNDLDRKVTAVYKALKAAVFAVSDNPDEESRLQWEIERRLAGTDPVDRFYQRKVAELLASQQRPDELAKAPRNEIELVDVHANTSQEASTSIATALGDNTAPSNAAHGEESKNYSKKVDQKLKWYFTDNHSKYVESYTSMKMEEDEKKTFSKRLLYRFRHQYKREELKEKM